MENMSSQEWKRVDAIERIAKMELSVGEAARILGISERQLWNIRQKVKKQGAAGVIHGLRGRSPPNRIKDDVREQIIALAQGKYAGFNDTHFSEKLPGEKIDASRATVQRMLRKAGVAPVRRRRSVRHRKRRERAAREGLMILWDGSRHAWLEDRGPMFCLMGAIDDATGKLLPGAHFVEQECAAGYLRVLYSIGHELGLPWVVYGDRHGSLKRNDDHWTLEEELRGEQDPTQVGRALKELGVEQIHALSPQAKGRVERMWGTLQDRLVSELRLAGATTIEEANAVLQRYIAEFNSRFAQPPRETTLEWRPTRGLDLERVCSFAYEAIVKNDNTVRIEGVTIDIPPGPGGRGYAKARVEVRQLLDGTWRVYHSDGSLIASTAPTSERELRAAKRRKRSAASEAFRKGVLAIVATAKRPRRASGPVKVGLPPPPFNSRPQLRRAAKPPKATASAIRSPKEPPTEKKLPVPMQPRDRKFSLSSKTGSFC
jgi:hypothetical protein